MTSVPLTPETLDDDDPRIAIRRHTDRCFHRVEEVTPQGCIVDGILIPHDDIKDAIALDVSGTPLPACKPVASLTPPTQPPACANP